MKKLLALVLALVMTLSLCVTSNAAYSDAADVDYNEAVDVMSAVGVFQGADGKFSPKAELTREQAAKLIAYLDLGESVAEALPAVKVFNDVEANRWSAKYVAYCADAGYLAGVGNNNFDPAGKLTGYAFGKMLLCVLGYDAAIEGFTGANWQIKVATLMESNNLAGGIDSSAALALTREAAAQYCLNALQATMVEYASKGTQVTINGAVISTGASAAKAVEVTNTDGDYADAIVNDNAAPSTKAILQLGEKLYQGKLAYNKTAKVDDFGRPAGVWAYDSTATKSTIANVANAKKVVSTAALKAPAYTFTVTSAEAFNNKTNAEAALKKFTKTALSYTGSGTAGSETLYVNGTADGDGYLTNLEIGDTVEVYVTNSTATRVAVISEYPAQILKVEANTGKAKTATKTDDNNDKIVYNWKITLDRNLDGNADITTNDLELPGFDAATYVAGAYLAVNATNAVITAANILDTKIATTVTGKITAYNNAVDSSTTIDGAKYKNAKTYVDGPSGSVDFKTGEYTAIIGSSGYMIGLKTVEAASAKLTDVAYTNGALWTKTSSNYGEYTKKYYAQLVYADGTVEDALVGGIAVTGTSGSYTKKDYGIATGNYTFDGTKTTASAAITADNVTLTENLYTVDTKTTNTNGDTVPEVKALATSATANAMIDGMTYVKGTGALTSYQFKTSATKWSTFYITDNSAFVLIKGSGSGTKANVYTGAPNYTTGASDDILYIYNNKTNELRLAVLPGSTLTIDSSERLFVKSSTSTVSANGYSQGSAYKMDGTAVDAFEVDNTDKSYTGFVTYQVKDNGVYDLTDNAYTAATIANASWNSDRVKTVEKEYYEGVKITPNSFYNDRVNLTSTGVLSDVPATGVVLVDLTSTSSRNGYEGEFKTFDDLMTCLNTIYDSTNNYYYDVVGGVYLDNATGVATIFVTGVAQNSRT